MGAGLLLRLLYLYSWIDSGGRALSAGVAAYHVRFWKTAGNRKAIQY